MQQQSYEDFEENEEYERPFYNDGYEDGGSMDRHWEKATSYSRRKTYKGLWAIVAIAALLVFMLGTSMNMWSMLGTKSMMPYSRDAIFSRHSMAARQSQMWPPEHHFSFFVNPTFTSIATNEVANALHLTPEQITAKMVNENYDLSAISAEQGISGDSLNPIEQKAFNDMLDAEIKAGYISSDEATQWKNLFLDNPGALDSVMGSMFIGFPIDISH